MRVCYSRSTSEGVGVNEYVTTYTMKKYCKEGEEGSFFIIRFFIALYLCRIVKRIFSVYVDHRSSYKLK